MERYLCSKAPICSPPLNRHSSNPAYIKGKMIGELKEHIQSKGCFRQEMQVPSKKY